MNEAPRIISANVDAASAVLALERALGGEIDPELDSPRLFSPFTAGEFLLMPTAGRKFAGVKVLTIPAGAPAAGHPKIQGVYVMFDAVTLAPVAVLDGAELTLSRTSATTALVIKHILHDRIAQPQRLVVFGSGPQAYRHIAALRAVCTISHVVVVGRRVESADHLAESCRAEGLSAETGHPGDVAGADVIVCVTSATEALFDGELVRAETIVAAVGSHGLDARELAPSLVRRADVVVESRASAMRESGDLIPARTVEDWARHPITNIAELVRGEFARRPGHPAVYSGVGMAWQDLVVAQAALDGVFSRPAPGSEA